MWTSHQDHLTTRWVRAALQSIPRAWCFSSVYCLTKDLRENSSQFLEAPAVPKQEQAEVRLCWGLALLCSLTHTAEKELLRAVQTDASFSPLHIDVHFCVLTSPISKMLPLISSSLPRWLAYVGSRVNCSQQSKGRSGTGLLAFCVSVDSNFISGRKCSQLRCIHFLNCPWYVCASFRYFEQVKRQQL